VREIGIRKALGAGPRAIAAQFLIEAALLSCTGGIVGVVAGAGAAVGAGAFIHTLKPAWVTAISVPAVVVALTASCAIGIVFGFVPARRASRLDPVAAMRR
jgi:putative ABC transport system permease protein